MTVICCEALGEGGSNPINTRGDKGMLHGTRCAWHGATARNESARIASRRRSRIRPFYRAKRILSREANRPHLAVTFKLRHYRNLDPLDTCGDLRIAFIAGQLEFRGTASNATSLAS